MTIDPRPQLIAAARHFYQQGWMVGTAGNLSARLPDDSFWITASGKPKGQLREQDFVRVGLDGGVKEVPHPDSRPSAETSIHRAIYRLFPQAQACYHVHSVEANLVSAWYKEQVELPPLEMLKGLGVWEEQPRVCLPLLENHLVVERIAQEIEARWSLEPSSIPALLIRHHGITVWADSPQTALNFVEIVEYLLRYLVLAR